MWCFQRRFSVWLRVNFDLIWAFAFYCSGFETSFLAQDLTCVCKTWQSHFSLCNLNRRLRLFVTFFAQGTLLLRHNWPAVNQIIDFLSVVHLNFFELWQSGYSQSLRSLNATLEGHIINLLEGRWVISTLCVDVMSQHALAVVNSADCWVSICATIRMESRFAEIGLERWVCKPSCRVVELGTTLVHFFFFLCHDSLFLSLFWLLGTLRWTSCPLTLGVLALDFATHIVLKNLNLFLLLGLFFYFGLVIIRRFSLFI